MMRWISKSKVIAAALAMVPMAAVAQDDATCGTTHECAQKMLASVAELNETDAVLAAQLETLTTRMAELAEVAETARATVLSRATGHTDERFAAMGSGPTNVPNWGNGTSPTCPAGQYMVGAKVNAAPGGDHAGVLYGLQPICRVFQ